jgi:hypothetical protein
MPPLDAASTPPGTAVDPDPSHPRGRIRAAGVLWQNGRTTEKMREDWAAGARGAKRCRDCTAPLVWTLPIGGELVCWGCAHSDLPLAWRRRVVQLWLTGAKAADIARKVHSTKSAVLGYRSRARLPERGSPLYGLPDSERAERRKRRSPAKAAPAAVKPENRAFFVRPKSVAKVQGSPTCKPAVPGGTVSVAENVDRPNGIPKHTPRHGFTECQYIIGRRTFCDQPTAAASPYCAGHTRLCYQGKAA